MLEILAMIWFAKKLGKIAREKGRHAPGCQVFGIFCWIVGEIMGAVAGASTGDQAAVYVFAILGAVISAVASYAIVKSLSPAPSQPVSTKNVSN